MKAQRSTEGVINYYGPVDGMVRIYGHDPSQNYANLQPHKMNIGDLSTSEQVADVEREGFAIYPAPVVNIDSNSSNRAEYLAEYLAKCIELIGDVSGSDLVRAVPNATVFRREDWTKDGNSDAPVFYAHIDITTDVLRTFKELIYPDISDYSRIAMYNIWRPLSQTPLNSPLTLCDSRSVQKEELVPIHAYYREGHFMPALMPKHSDSHRWHYYSAMTKDDCLVFKSGETDPSKSQPVLHTAFEDKNVSVKMPPRVSVEARAVALWR